MNSARDYEFWGFDWWFPFWDSEYMLFWEKIPLKLRKNKLLYNEYVDLLFKRITDIEAYLENKIIIQKKSISLIKKIIPKKPFIYCIRKHRLKSSILRQILGVMGAFSDDFLSKHKKTLPSINGLFAIYTVEELKRELIK